MNFNEEHRVTSLPRARPPLHKNCQCHSKIPVAVMSPAKYRETKKAEDGTTDETDEIDYLSRNLSFDQRPEVAPSLCYRLSSSNPATPVKEPEDHHENDTGSNASPERESPHLTKSLKFDRKVKVNSLAGNSRAVAISAIALIISIGFTTGPLFSCFYNMSSAQESFELRNELTKLGQKYGQTSEFWGRIESSLLITNTSHDVSVFILAYGQTYDAHKVNFFAREIARIASIALNGTSARDEPLVLNSHDVEDEDFLPNYRLLLRQRRAMVVHNVNRVSAEFAKPLHFFCDEYNPLVRKSAILFTLDTSECQSGAADIGRSPEQFELKTKAEDCLRKAWQKLPSEYLLPLLARIVNVILFVDTTKLEES